MDNNITIIKDLNRFNFGEKWKKLGLGDWLIIKTYKIRKETYCKNYSNCKNTIPKDSLCIVYGESIRQNKFTGKINKFCSINCLKQDLNNLLSRSQELNLFFDNINAIMEVSADSSQP